MKIFSHTEPKENVLKYTPWQLELDGEWREMRHVAGRSHGKGLVAQLEGIGDRDAAATLVGAKIAVERDELPAPGPGEYYWADLEGMRVQNRDGVELGVVAHLMATGSNDVLVINGERERLVPFIEPDVVESVDFAQSLIQVDWDPEF